jgi:dTDP-4-amino-4,6-dideoxygalactose transaminase
MSVNPGSKMYRAVEESVKRSLQSTSWCSYQGENLEKLTSWFSSSTDCRFVRLCSSGTLGVELALRSIQLGKDDEVLLSGYDYPGNFKSIEDIPAKVVLCNPPSSRRWTLGLEDIEQTVAPKTKAMVITHLHGELAPMPEIMDWAVRRGIFVIEDACQSHGAKIGNRAAGAWGHLGVFSLGGSKLVSAGRGGVVVTDDELFSQRMKVYCERGNDAFALSEIQAALALPQCELLGETHAKRFASADRLRSQLMRYSWLETVPCQPESSQAFYKFGICIKGGANKPLRDLVLAKLIEHGIEAGTGFAGFANRSRKRFRTANTLDATQSVADNTIVIHHTMLYDPYTETDCLEAIVTALDRANQEIVR